MNFLTSVILLSIPLALLFPQDASLLFGQTQSDSSKKTNLALVSSGAVSLGSYQAGFHYYEIEWLKQNRDIYDVKMITGASAGAINSLLSALALADTTCSYDTASVFYQAWLPIGLKELKDYKKDKLGIISRDKLNAIADSVIGNALNKIKSHPTADSIDLVLAVASTRVKPLKNSLGPLSIPKVKEQFVVRIRKNRDSPLQFRNYLYKDLNMWWSVLPLDNPFPKDILKGIVLASSAFPGAFAPYTNLPLYLVNTHEINRQSGNTADIWSSENDRLIATLDSMKTTQSFCVVDTPLLSDGGIVNNQPIRLAHRLCTDGLDSLGNWKTALSRECERGDGNKIEYLYLYPGNYRYPEIAKDTTMGQGHFLKYLFTEFSNILNATMKNELYALLEDDDKIGQHIRPTKNYSPQMSVSMFHFFGFVQKSFRLFDFYLGMYDAERFMRTLPKSGVAKYPIIKCYSTYDFKNNFEKNAAEEYLKKLDSLTIVRRGFPQRWGDTLHVRCEYLLIKSVLDSIYQQIDSMHTRNPQFSLPVADSLLLAWSDGNTKSCFQASLDLLWAQWANAIDHTGKMTDTVLQRYQVNWKALLSHEAPFPPNLLGRKDTSGYLNQLKTELAQGNEENALILALDKNKYMYTDIASHPFLFGKDRLKHALLNDFIELGFSTVANSNAPWYEKYLLWHPVIIRTLNYYYYAPKFWYITPTYSASRGTGGWSIGLDRLFFTNGKSLSLLFTGHLGYYGFPKSWYSRVGLESMIHCGFLLQPRLTVEALSYVSHPKNIGLQITPSVTLFEFFRIGVGFQYYESQEDNLQKNNTPYLEHPNFHVVFQAGFEFSHRDFQYSTKHEGLYSWLIPVALAGIGFGAVYAAH
jgi:hypothetical protein